jgi:hypothetical protein
MVPEKWTKLCRVSDSFRGEGRQPEERVQKEAEHDKARGNACLFLDLPAELTKRLAGLS